MKKQLRLSVAVFFLLAACGGIFAAQPAARYVGNLRDHLSLRPYYGITLERRNRIPGKDFIDAIVFTPLASGYRYIRREDADHRVVINSIKPRRQAAQVQPHDINEYERLIKANDMRPYLVKNKKGEELAIVYCALKPCYIIDSQRPNGEVIIELAGSLRDERRELERMQQLLGIPR
ncbi:MAG: hypothetical protein PHT59_07770 [Candidatus Omnitrophica bacterium]|nr:hypothetical protein [Candidatus Omnitrophota bacterium]